MEGPFEQLLYQLTLSDLILRSPSAARASRRMATDAFASILRDARLRRAPQDEDWYLRGHSPHSGKLSCRLAGISTVLWRSMASARAMRRRVACGMITSSI